MNQRLSPDVYLGVVPITEDGGRISIGDRGDVIECVLSEAEARRRLEQRLREEGIVSDGRWEIYLEQVRDFEAITEAAPGRHLRLDTSAPKGQVVESAIEWLTAA